MRSKLAVSFLLALQLTAQPTQSDRYKYAPMVAAAKLWNTIRYLHPRVTGDSTKWDAALMAAIPKIEAAHSDDELAVALDEMLATLNDPCTRIAHGMPGKGLTVQSMESDTMVIHAGNGDLAGNLGAGLMIKMGIPQTNHVVWDLRGSRMPFSISTRPDLKQLSSGGIGYAYREHSGYAQQDNGGLRRYFSSIQMVDPQPVKAIQTATSTWRQVYLVDKDSAVPVRAVIDQLNARTAILSEDPPREAQIGFTQLVTVLGKVAAEVRVAELRYPDGTTGFAPTRVVLNRGDEAVKASINAINAGNWSIPGERPDFEPGIAGFRDVPYATEMYPAREMRILGAIRLWGVLRLFHPFVSRIGDKWDDVLVEFLPRVADAKDAGEYHRAIAEMAARTGDPGCTARSTALEELFGPATAPFEVRFLEGQPVITRRFRANGAEPGDVILKINDKPVQTRIEELSRVIADTGPEGRWTQIARYLVTAPKAGMVKLTVKGKSGEPRDLMVTLNPANQTTAPEAREGDAIRLLDERTGYVDLERIEAADVEKAFGKFSQTAAIIFDLRGYPRYQAMTIAAHLAHGGQSVAAELFHNVVGLGTEDSHVHFVQSELRIPRTPRADYKGKTVALIDDLPLSFGGEDAMYLKAANQTVLIGTTAFPMFANYATLLDVPGAIKVTFSGEMPRWPGGKLLYPEGVKPDVLVRPTIAGIREKRDEVLEGAIKYLKGELAANERE